MKTDVFSVVEPSPAKNLIPVFEELTDRGYEVAVYGHGEGAEVLAWEGIEAPTLGRPRRRSRLAPVLFALDLTRVLLREILDGPSVAVTSGNTGDARKTLLASKALGIPSLHVEMDVYNPVEAIRFATAVAVPEQAPDFDPGGPEVIEISGPPIAAYIADRHLKGRVPGPVPEDVKGRVLVCLGGDVTEDQALGLLEALRPVDPYVVPFRVEAPPGFDRPDTFIDLPGAMMEAKAVIFAGGFGVTVEACLVARKAVKVSGVHDRHFSHEVAKACGIRVLNVEEVNDPEDVLAECSEPDGGWLIRAGRDAVGEVSDAVEELLQG